MLQPFSQPITPAPSRAPPRTSYHGPTMQVSFNFAAADLRAYFDYSYAHDRTALRQQRESRRSLSAWLAVCIVFGVGLGVESLRIIARTDYLPVICAGAAAMAILTAGNVAREMLGRSRSQHTEHAMSQSASASTFGPVTVSLTAEGVTHTGRSGCTFVRWDRGIDSIVETTDHIFIFCHPTGALVIPRSAFASPGEASEFARTARGHLADAGGPEHARDLLRFLAAYDEDCPGCGFNLRALTQPRCPECGRQIAGEDLPKFRKLGPPPPPPRNASPAPADPR